MTNITRFIDYMIENPRWNSITKQMAWAFRKASIIPPVELQPWFKVMPTREDWLTISAQINKQTTSIRAKRKRAVEAAKEHAHKKRRQSYMKNYRTRKPKGGDFLTA